MSWQDFSKLCSSQGKVVTKRKHHHPAQQQQKQASLLVQQKATYIWAMDTRIIIIIGVVINIIAMNVKCHHNYSHIVKVGKVLVQNIQLPRRSTMNMIKTRVQHPPHQNVIWSCVLWPRVGDRCQRAYREP